MTPGSDTGNGWPTKWSKPAMGMRSDGKPITSYCQSAAQAHAARKRPQYNIMRLPGSSRQFQLSRFHPDGSSTMICTGSRPSCLTTAGLLAGWQGEVHVKDYL